MVFVTVSETYDLSTKPNKMSLIGIHTPSASIIQKTYPGLCLNSKFCRIVKQDVTMACASLLPADPLQVGVDSGDIAPQDMFNPILYKAVSNESMSTLESRLFGLMKSFTSAEIVGESLVKTDEVTGLDDDFNAYYSLLSNRDGFKTAAPQSGLNMHGLVPLVFEKYYNIGTNSTNSKENSVHGGNWDTPVVPGLDVDPTLGTRLIDVDVRSMRGRAHPMPRFNTTFITGATGSESGSAVLQNGMGNGYPRNCQTSMPELMPVYTAAIVMPPSKLNRLYYRMVVRTTLEFTEIRPITEVTSFAQMATQYAQFVYASDYDTQSMAMTQKLGMVDAKDADLQKIMEGA